MRKIVVVIAETPRKERRYLTTGDMNDAKRIATRLVILKSQGEIHDWGVFPVETIGRTELEEMLGMW